MMSSRLGRRLKRKLRNGIRAGAWVVVWAVASVAAVAAPTHPETGPEIAALDRASELFETGYRYQLGEGDTERDLKRALTFYAQALRVYPDGYPKPFAVLYNSALIYSELKRYRDAQSAFIRAARAARELARTRTDEASRKVAAQWEALARNGLGTCYQRDGKLREAEQQYRIAIRKDPTLVEAHFNLLNLLSEEKRWDELERQLVLSAQVAPSPRYEIFHGRRAGQKGQQGLGAFGGMVAAAVMGAALLAYYLLLRVRRARCR